MKNKLFGKPVSPNNDHFYIWLDVVDVRPQYTDLKITWHRETEMAARRAHKFKPPFALISSLGLDQMLFYTLPLWLLFLLSAFLAMLQVTRAIIHHCSSESRCHGWHGENVCLRKRRVTKTRI